jgi:hypothetical protein
MIKPPKSEKKKEKLRKLLVRNRFDRPAPRWGKNGFFLVRFPPVDLGGFGLAHYHPSERMNSNFLLVKSKIFNIYKIQFFFVFVEFFKTNFYILCVSYKK